VFVDREFPIDVGVVLEVVEPLLERAVVDLGEGLLQP